MSGGAAPGEGFSVGRRQKAHAVEGGEHGGQRGLAQIGLQLFGLFACRAETGDLVVGAQPANETQKVGEFGQEQRLVCPPLATLLA